MAQLQQQQNFPVSALLPAPPPPPVTPVNATPATEASGGNSSSITLSSEVLDRLHTAARGLSSSEKRALAKEYDEFCRRVQLFSTGRRFREVSVEAGQVKQVEPEVVDPGLKHRFNHALQAIVEMDVQQQAASYQVVSVVMPVVKYHVVGIGIEVDSRAQREAVVEANAVSALVLKELGLLHLAHSRLRTECAKFGVVLRESNFQRAIDNMSGSTSRESDILEVVYLRNRPHPPQQCGPGAATTQVSGVGHDEDAAMLDAQLPREPEAYDLIEAGNTVCRAMFECDMDRTRMLVQKVGVGLCEQLQRQCPLEVLTAVFLALLKFDGPRSIAGGDVNLGAIRLLENVLFVWCGEYPGFTVEVTRLVRYYIQYRMAPLMALNRLECWELFNLPPAERDIVQPRGFDVKDGKGGGGKNVVPRPAQDQAVCAFADSLMPSPERNEALRREFDITKACIERTLGSDRVRCDMYGSIVNGFATKHSDVDMVVNMSEELQKELLGATDFEASDAAAAVNDNLDSLEGESSQKKQHQQQASEDRQRAVKLAAIARLAPELEKEGYRVARIEDARVPIVVCKRFVLLEGIEEELEVNISFMHEIVVHNSRLLRCYADMDIRVKRLAVLVKAWAKARDVNDAFTGTLSSYSYVLLVLSLLMSPVHGLIPSLQAPPPHLVTSDSLREGDVWEEGQKYPVRKLGGQHDAWFLDYERDLGMSPAKARKALLRKPPDSGGRNEAVPSGTRGPRQPFPTSAAGAGKGRAGGETVVDLLYSFFYFYAYEHNFYQHVVSIKEQGICLKPYAKTEYFAENLSGLHDGRPSSVKPKLLQNYRLKRRVWLCLEDPFEFQRDLGCSASGQERLTYELRRAVYIMDRFKSSSGGSIVKKLLSREFPFKRHVSERPFYYNLNKLAQTDTENFETSTFSSIKEELSRANVGSTGWYKTDSENPETDPGVIPDTMMVDLFKDIGSTFDMTSSQLCAMLLLKGYMPVSNEMLERWPPLGAQKCRLPSNNPGGEDGEALVLSFSRPRYEAFLARVGRSSLAAAGSPPAGPYSIGTAKSSRGVAWPHQVPPPPPLLQAYQPPPPPPTTTLVAPATPGAPANSKAEFDAMQLLGLSISLDPTEVLDVANGAPVLAPTKIEGSLLTKNESESEGALQPIVQRLFDSTVVNKPGSLPPTPEGQSRGVDQMWPSSASRTPIRGSARDRSTASGTKVWASKTPNKHHTPKEPLSRNEDDAARIKVSPAEASSEVFSAGAAVTTPAGSGGKNRGGPSTAALGHSGAGGGAGGHNYGSRNHIYPAKPSNNDTKAKVSAALAAVASAKSSPAAAAIASDPTADTSSAPKQQTNRDSRGTSKSEGRGKEETGSGRKDGQGEARSAPSKGGASSKQNKQKNQWKAARDQWNGGFDGYYNGYPSYWGGAWY